MDLLEATDATEMRELPDAQEEVDPEGKMVDQDNQVSLGSQELPELPESKARTCSWCCRASIRTIASRFPLDPPDRPSFTSNPPEVFCWPIQKEEREAREECLEFLAQEEEVDMVVQVAEDETALMPIAPEHREAQEDEEETEQTEVWELREATALLVVRELEQATEAGQLLHPPIPNYYIWSRSMLDAEIPVEVGLLRPQELEVQEERREREVVE
jgi:hypothetical protein